jgi:hypothetical protein
MSAIVLLATMMQLDPKAFLQGSVWSSAGQILIPSHISYCPIHSSYACFVACTSVSLCLRCKSCKADKPLTPR